jgi:hypothetical protein
LTKWLTTKAAVFAEKLSVLGVRTILLNWLRTKAAMLGVSMLMAGSAIWFSVSHCSSPLINTGVSPVSPENSNVAKTLEKQEAGEPLTPSPPPGNHQTTENDYEARGAASINKMDYDQAIST